MVKKRGSSSNISRKAAIALIIGGFLLTVAASGAYDQVGADRDFNIGVADDENALVQLNMEDPIIVDVTQGQGGGGSNAKNVDLIVITNNYDSDMDINIELTDNTDKGVNIKKNKKTISPQQSESFYININSKQRPRNIEIKIEVNGEVQTTIYRTATIEYNVVNNGGGNNGGGN